MNHLILLFFATLVSPRVVFFAIQEAIPSDKGKPGETRGRKVTGLHLLQSGYDRRTTEMGKLPVHAAPPVKTG
jgi:hypothetical protein